MKNIILATLLSAVVLPSYATDPRPHVVHMGSQSCLTSYYGNETFVTCDESAWKIDQEFAKENARITEQKLQEIKDAREERELDKMYEEKRIRREKDIDDRYAVAKEKYEQCLRKRMPKGANINNAKVKDLDACVKYLNIEIKMDM